MTRWPSAFWIAVIAAGLFAAIGLLVVPTPSNPARAVAFVRSATPLAVQAQLASPLTIQAIARSSSLPPSAVTARLTTRLSIESGLIAIHAAGPTDPAALKLVGLATQAILATSGTSATTWDFLHSAGGWDVGRSMFNEPPRSAGLFPARSPIELIVTCDVPRSGCGPFVSIRGPFLAGRIYAASAFVSGTARASVQLVLGSPAATYNTSGPVTIGPGWTRLQVRWSPRRTAPSAELAIQLRDRGQHVMTVGEATLDGVAAAPLGGTQQVGAPLSVAGPSDKRPLAALVGGALGFLLVASALAFAALATRRQREPQPEPDLDVEPVAAHLGKHNVDDGARQGS